MEQLFIRILNRTLLAAGVLLLAVAVFGAVVAAYLFWNSSNPKVVKGDVSVAYTAFVPNRAAVNQAGSTNEPGQTGPTLSSLNAATVCSAMGEFVQVISNRRMNIIGDGAASCAKAENDEAKTFGGQAQSFLKEAKKHFKALAADPNVKLEFPDKGDDQVKQYVEDAVAHFNSAFQEQVEAQAASNDEARSGAAEQRVQALSLVGAAGGAFLAFLLIAFLIVFLRIEKHLDKLKDRVSITPVTG